MLNETFSVIFKHCAKDVVLNWSQSWLVALAALVSPRVSSFVFATKTNAILAMLLRTTLLRGQWLWNAPGLLYIFVYYLDCSFHMESRIIIELWNDYWCRSTKNDDVLVLYRDKKRDWEAPNWGGLFCDIFKETFEVSKLMISSCCISVKSVLLVRLGLCKELLSSFFLALFWSE